MNVSYGPLSLKKKKMETHEMGPQMNKKQRIIIKDI